jgi:TRAP-type C4-dicarboxylate transport system permease small subunit
VAHSGKVGGGLLGVLKGAPFFCHVASCVPLMLLVCITTADVLARYLFRSSVPDAAEISGMLLGLCISLSLAYTTLKGEQVTFDLVVNRLRGRARIASDAVTLLLSGLLFATIAWQTVKRALDSMKAGEYVGAMEMPVWPAKAVFAVGCLLTAGVLLSLSIGAFRRLFRKTG